MHTTPLQSILQDIRTNVGLYAILDPETLKKELEKREYSDAEAASRIMGDMHDIFITTRTKPRLNEIRNLSNLAADYLHLPSNKVFSILNDLNDAVFPDTVRGCSGH